MSEDKTWAMRRFRLGRSAAGCRAGLADVVDGLIVEHESNVGMLQREVGGQHAVVRLNDGGGGLEAMGRRKSRACSSCRSQRRETLRRRAKAGASATTHRVENEETLEADALLSKAADGGRGDVNRLLADGVVTHRLVVGRVLAFL